MDIKSSIFIYLILQLFFLPKIYSYIVIPFKTHKKNLSIEENQIYNSKTFIENDFSNNIYLLINVGTPPKKIPFSITTKSLGINIGFQICSKFLFQEPEEGFSTYSINNSISYKNTGGISISVANFITGTASNESMQFIMDINNNETSIVNDINFVYSKKYDNKNILDDQICGLLGLELCELNAYSTNFNFILTLKKQKIINNYVFYFKYTTDNEGIMIIGEEPHLIQNDKYKEYQLKKDYAINEDNLLTWGTQFNNIYFYDKNTSKILINDVYFAKFIPELNCIIGTETYKKYIDEYFFEPYIKNNSCRYNKEYSIADGYKSFSYYVLNCDINSNFNMENFPTLYFFHRLFNYTFELNYEDLFITKGNKIYFMVIFSCYGIAKHYEFGKIFLKKYFFSFNQDSKLIGFYNKDLIENEGSNKSNFNYALFISVGIFILIIVSIIGFFVGKLMHEKTKKKRIYEIEDNYEYISENKENKEYNDRENKIINEE